MVRRKQNSNKGEEMTITAYQNGNNVTVKFAEGYESDSSERVIFLFWSFF